MDGAPSLPLRVSDPRRVGVPTGHPGHVGHLPAGCSGTFPGDRGDLRGIPGGPRGALRDSPGDLPGPPQMAEHRPRKVTNEWPNQSEHSLWFPAAGAEPRGSGGAPPTTLILLRNQRKTPRARRHRDRRDRWDGGVPELPFGKVPRAARGAGRAQQLVLRQEVGELTLPGGYSLRHAGRVRLPTHRVLAALRPERLTRRADAHTTFLAAREACYPAAGRHQRVSPTLGETLCWTSCPSPEVPELPYALRGRRAESVPRGEKKFFS